MSVAARFAGQIGEVRPIGLGMYEDEGRQLHIDIPELLHIAGYADTPANRDMAVRSVAEALKKKSPHVPLIYGTERGLN